MKIRKSNPTDADAILELFYAAFGRSRYDEIFAPQWVNCFLSSPIIFPSFVVEDEKYAVLGYIVWRVKKVSEEHRIIIELQELTAKNGKNKLQIEKFLFERSPHEVICSVSEIEHVTINSCGMYVWVHHLDAQSNKSVFCSSESTFGTCLGGVEREDARGGVMMLYQQEHNCLSHAQY